ncbi:MAG: SGNH/GDSL hydrolase family protein [Chitinophagales bacterium]|nr:SGNH/GDSL hydrolase family protein [Chitinophagales bacterium]MDW8418678.1 SGNH/GDSL hydrolase family protein [Chitinophagales bacterium]
MFRKLFVSVVVTVAALLAAEVALRCCGFKPGKYIYSPWIKEINPDTLRALHGFAADSEGVFKIHPAARLWIDSVIGAECDNRHYTTDRSTLPWQVHEVYSLHYEMLLVIHGLVKNELSTRYHTLKSKVNMSELEKALIAYVQHPVNEDGFRSIAFKPYPGAKKILLLGDSFTWGHSAHNITGSFADCLLARGYAVYNTGISGADPAQYLMIAKRYIPVLKPDVVIVNFYSGNDVIYFDRTPEPYQPLFYATNAGNIISHPQHCYLRSADSAYRFAMACSYIPLRTLFNKLSATTALSTLLWKVLAKSDLLHTNPIGFDEYFERSIALKRKTPTANDVLPQIATLAQSHGARCEFVFIPELLPLRRLSNPAHYRGLSRQIPFLVPQEITPAHYKTEDGHFNEAGHRAYADFLEKIIRGEWKKN